MPLTLQTPVDIIPASPAVQANCFDIIECSFNMNPTDVPNQHILAVYAAGSIDSTGTNTTVGSNRTVVIPQSELMLGTTPQLIADIKALVFDAISKVENVTGTIS